MRDVAKTRKRFLSVMAGQIEREYKRAFCFGYSLKTKKMALFTNF
jgi:hypothetical protein